MGQRPVEQVVELFLVHKTHRMMFRQVSTMTNFQRRTSTTTALPSNVALCACATVCVTTVQLCLLSYVCLWLQPLWSLCCLYTSALVALVMLYSAVVSIRSVKLFHLCGLIMLVAPAIVSTYFLFIVSYLIE